MPGPKPQPTALKLIRGNPGKRPVNSQEPKPKQTASVPSAPAYLGTKAKSEWKRIAKELHETGVLTRIDTKALANYCMAYEDMLTAMGLLHAHNLQNPTQKNVVVSMTGNIKTHPLVDQVRNHRMDMMRFASEFGLTPSSRSKVKVKGQDKGNEFDDF